MKNAFSFQTTFNEYKQLLLKQQNTAEEEELIQIQARLIELKTQLNNYVVQQLQIENISPEFITLVSELDSLEMHGKKISEDREENTFTLATKYIIDPTTNELISLSELPVYSKIEKIYNYTGTIVSCQDEGFTVARDNSFNEFLSNINKYVDTKVLINRYGDNWREEVERLYKQGYDNAIQNHINNIVEKVNIDNIDRYRALQTKAEQSEKEIEKLNTEVSELKEEVVELTSTIRQIQTERKDELNKYKETMEAMIKNNSEDERRFYQDGTTRPDMNWDEYGRHTTRRDRKNETGMQERVNDVAHVHDELNDMEKVKLQKKYDKAFDVITKEDVVNALYKDGVPLTREELSNGNKPIEFVVDKKREIQIASSGLERNLKYDEYNPLGTGETYGDGTYRPDMNMEDVGRFTVKRNRGNETGMQQRVNDAAHIHDELNELERMILQEKYERVFGEMRIEEEDKPKSR